MFRKTLLTAGTAGVLALGLAGAANASSVPAGHSYSQNLAGYGTIFTGNKAFNDVRSDLTVPAENGLVPANSVAVGIVLQAYSNAPSPTVGLGLVWDSTSGGTCADGGAQSDQWTLEEGHSASAPAGVPLPPSSLTPILTSGNLICIPSGTSRYYVEIHDSTFLNKIGFDAGALEPGDNLLTVPVVFGPGFRFHEAGVGVDTSTGAAASDLTPGTLAGFWRDGLTLLLDPSNPKGATDSRITLDKYDMQEFLGTADGTPSGTASLTPSGLGVGSAFTVTANT